MGWSIRFSESGVILVIVIISQSKEHVTRANSFLLQVMHAQDMGSAPLNFADVKQKRTRLHHMDHLG